LTTLLIKTLWKNLSFILGSGGVVLNHQESGRKMTMKKPLGEIFSFWMLISKSFEVKNMSS